MAFNLKKIFGILLSWMKGKILMNTIGFLPKNVPVKITEFGCLQTMTKLSGLIVKYLKLETKNGSITT